MNCFKVKCIWKCPKCFKQALRELSQEMTALCCNNCLTIVDWSGKIVGSAGNEKGQTLIRNS